MTTLLTNADKAQIINSRLKSLAYNKYNIEIDLIVENAKDEPSTASVSALNNSMLEVNSQISALSAELDKYPVE
jgi:ABC-type phosphate transport system auxiliary subunit